MRKNKRNGQVIVSRGFSLIEVLIALVVLAIGLLGVAGLQSAGMRHTQAANLQSQASMYASNMADRLRANDEAIDQGYFNNTIDESPGTPDVDCDATECSPTDLAAYDVSNWYADLGEALPMGSGIIRCHDADCEADSQFTITVQWDGHRTGPTSAKSNDKCDRDNEDAYVCYRITFVPLPSR